MKSWCRHDTLGFLEFSSPTVTLLAYCLKGHSNVAVDVNFQAFCRILIKRFDGPVCHLYIVLK